jgi:hypothetical protein
MAFVLFALNPNRLKSMDTAGVVMTMHTHDDPHIMSIIFLDYVISN